MKSTPAQKLWKQQDYINRKEYFRNRDKDRRSKLKIIINDAKNRPCLDCGHSYPPRVMDLHHRNREEKIYDISDVKMFSSEKKLREEIAKCDVICSNCHRLRHNDV